jgi:hypothetical protein
MLLLALLAAGAAAKQAPWFCHDLDCPTYKVLNTTEDYELRKYPAGMWVSTETKSLLLETAMASSFKVLYAYISGENELGAKINMTAPVRTKLEAGAGPFCKSTFTVSFFVPFKYQDESPPKPTNPDVYLETTPQQTVYVAQWGGFALGPTVGMKASALYEELEKEGVSAVTGSYYYAGYDPPFRLTKRHNEVWIVAGDTAPEDAATTA